MSKLHACGDYIFVEKVDYNEEETTEAGIIIKKSQMIDSSYVETKIISMGSGDPLPNGEVPSVPYEVGSTIVYDVRSRLGVSKDFDIIKRENVVGWIG